MPDPTMEADDGRCAVCEALRASDDVLCERCVVAYHAEGLEARHWWWVANPTWASALTMHMRDLRGEVKWPRAK